MLAACPNCQGTVDTDRGAFCPSCGGPIVPEKVQPPPAVNFVADDPVPIRVARSNALPYGRKRSRSPKFLVLLTTFIVAGSSIASSLIIGSYLLRQEQRQEFASPATAPPAQPIPSTPPQPRVARPAPSVPPSGRAANGKPATPTERQLEAAREGLTLVGEFSASELFQRAATEPLHPTMKFLLYQMCIEQAIDEGNLPIAMRAVDDIVANWDFENPTAFRSQVQQRFAAKTPTAPIVSEPKPRVTSGRATEEAKKTPSIDRSNTLTLKAIPLDLTRKSLSIPVAISHVDVEPRSLIVEVTSIKGATADAYYPPDRRTKLGSKLRIALRDTLPKAGIQTSLVGGGMSIVQVRFEPILIPFDQKEYAWSVDRVKTLLAQANALVDKQTAGIPLAEAEIKRAAADWNALIARYGDNVAAPQVAAAKTAALARLENAKSALALLQTELPINRERAKAASELAELTRAVHKSAIVHFRVFYLEGEREIEIARTE